MNILYKFSTYVMNNIKIELIEFDIIDVSEGTYVLKQVYQKTVIFITVGTSQIKVLSFNQMPAINSMIY